MNVDDLNNFLTTQFVGFEPVPVVESATAHETVARLPFHGRWIRPGNTLSGPAMMTLSDAVAYMALLAQNDQAAGALTSNLQIHFLKRPAPTDLIAKGHVIKCGRRLAVVGVDLFSNDELVAHATVTFAMP
ncbi:MAG TPA: PaaI family thioesterase [Myxococcales bacterium]|nr:PaaI family thioesterase [Myxococcales bacterium]